MTTMVLSREIEVEAPAARPIAPWISVHGWLALLPVIFIAVSGWIQADSGPVAFRFTAMEEDSFARRMTRVACSLLMLLLISTRFREVVSVLKKKRLFLVLPALAFASAIWSQNPAHTLVDAVNLALTTLFAVYLLVRYPGERMITFLSFAAAVCLLLCVYTVIFVPQVGIDAFQQDSWRGVFGQRNNCAVICVCFLVVALHHRASVLGEQMVRWTVLILAPVFIVMSGSRTGWALTVFAVALTVSLRLLQRMRGLNRIVVLMAIAVPVAALAYAVASNFNETLAMMDKDPTMTQRTVIWAEVMPSIAKHPLEGYGYSAFWSGLNGESMQTVLVTGWMEGQAQDGYLDLLLQLGTIGAVPLILMFVCGGAQAWRAVQTAAGQREMQFAAVLLPLVLVENIGESSFLLSLGIPWFFSLLAFLILAQSPKHVGEV
jgi:O-antigen ligase